MIGNCKVRRRDDFEDIDFAAEAKIIRRNRRALVRVLQRLNRMDRGALSPKQRSEERAAIKAELAEIANRAGFKIGELFGPR